MSVQADNPPAQPRFSVVTPSFKQLEWLKLCAASVADQSGVEVEHIIQDAGTGPELEAWAATRPGLKVVIERDIGMYDAINRGLKIACGEICSYLNCDEQYLPGTLKAVQDFFDAHPNVEVVFGDAILINSQGEPISYRRTVLPGRIHTRLVHLNTLSCSTFFRRSILERDLLFDPAFRAIGDAVWVHRLLAERVCMAVLLKPLSVFTFTGENLGAAEKAKIERWRWQQAPDAPPSILYYPAVFWNRLKKLSAGAYLPRSCSIDVYTRDIPQHRRNISTSRIGFSWPEFSGATPSVKPAVVQSSTPASPHACSDRLKVFAVFTSFNRPEIALSCLKHLLNQTVRPHRIIIADNGSTDSAIPEIRRLYGTDPAVDFYVIPKNLGNSGGVRIAMQRALASGADAVWILDDDSWPHPGALEKLLAHYERDHVLSSLVFDPAKEDISWPYVLLLPRKQIASHFAQLPDREVFEIRGAWLGALVAREILEKSGLPDPRFFIRGEDEEFPLRLRTHGIRFFCVKNSLLDHPSPARLIRLHLFGVNFFYEPKLADWKLFYMIRNRVFIHRKYSKWWLGGLIKGVFTIILAATVAVLFDDHKIKRFFICVRAGWDGLISRLGTREIF